MKKINIPLVSSTFIALFATNSFAFDVSEVSNANKPFMTEFNKLDTAKSGELSWKSVNASDKSIKYKAFDTYDKDKSGTLNYDEFAELKTDKSRAMMERVASDSWITTKVKTDLLAEKDLKSLKISVETHKGQVLLSGFVDGIDQKRKAEAVVKNVEGVKSVENSIIVKGES